jgi:hypothetical protein
MFCWLQNVGGAAHAQWSSVQHVGVDHCGAHVLVAQQLLDRADVLAPLQQVGGKRMAEGVAAGCLGHASCRDGPLHGLLHDARIQMVVSLGA